MLKLKKVSRITTTALLILLVSLPIAAFKVPSVSAHEDEHVHRYMSGEALGLLPYDSAMWQEINEYMDRIKDGSYNEDHHDHVYDIITKGIMSIPHFWDADLGPNDKVKDIWGIDDQYPNAYQKSIALFQEALNYYNENPPDYFRAYERLGHAAHLIEDQSVPAHVHEDFHVDVLGMGDDCFEKWMASPPPDEGGYKKWDHVDANRTGGLIRFPDDVETETRNGNWSAGLYYLMYTTNQYADYFASDDRNGDTDDREVWMDYSGWPSSPTQKSDLKDNDYHWEGPIPYDDNNNRDGDLGRIAEKSYVYSIRAVATLYKMFYELTHLPQASIKILDANADGAADYRYVRLDLTYDVGAPAYFGDLEARFKNEGYYDAWTDWMSAGGVPGGRRASWILSEGDGTKTVSYQVRNLMGNTTTVSDTIELKTIGMPQVFHYEFDATGYQSVTAELTVYMQTIYVKTEDTDGIDKNVEFYYRAFVETEGKREGEHREPGEGYYDIAPGGTKSFENNMILDVPVTPGQSVMLRTHGRDDDSPGVDDDWDNPVADDRLGGVHTDWYTVPTEPGWWLLVDSWEEDKWFNLKDDGSVNPNYEIQVHIAAWVYGVDWSDHEVPPYPMNPAWVAYGAPEEIVASSTLKAPYPYEYTTKWQPENIVNPAIGYRMDGSPNLWAWTNKPEPSMVMAVLSPVDFEITDPAGNNISSYKHVLQVGFPPKLLIWWELTSNVPGATLIRAIDLDRDGDLEPIDLDGDGVTDTLIVFDERAVGDYQVQVFPSIGTNPTETYSIGVLSSALPYKAGFLSQDIQLTEIPTQPLIMKSTVETLNLPPNADANGPYWATEGTTINFNASGSTDPDGDPLTYRWDFENDGTWNTEWSSSPTASHTWTDDWTGTVKVEVSDGQSSDNSTAKVTISNAPPTVNAGPDQLATVGDEVHFTGSFTDQGTDTHTIVWDFGDGTTATGTLIPTHVYSAAKIYTVTLNVTDDDGDVGRDTLTVNTGVEVSIDPILAIVPPGDDTTYNVIIHNLGNTQESYNLRLYELDPTWYSLQTHSITLDPDQSETVTLTVFPPNTAAIKAYEFTVVASSQTDPTILDKADADAIVATAHDLDLEEIPPVTNLVIGQPKYIDPINNKIYVTSATSFTLTAEDNPSGTGIASTFYHIQNTTHDTGRLKYTAPFCLTDLSDGQYSIVYYSKDNVANKEQAKSEPVILDNTPPAIVNIVANPNPVSVNVPVTLTATLDGSGTDGSRIVSAKCSVDGSDWMPMNAVDGQFDEATEEVTAAINPFPLPDVLYIAVRSTDAVGNTGSPASILLAVYDPTAGFVTGGGWINSPLGAYSADPTLTGKATFGFVSKYQKGANIPTGQTEFQFHAANLDFHSTSYEWLVVAGPRAQFKGSGTINKAGNYGFMLTAIDGQINGGGGIDKFRIKIWDKATGIIIYDNQMGDADTANSTTAIAGGSIIIHTK